MGRIDAAVCIGRHRRGHADRSSRNTCQRPFDVGASRPGCARRRLCAVGSPASHEQENVLKRILMLLGLLGVALSTGSSPHAQSCGANPIVCENNLTGNPQSEWDISGAGDASIQGFANDISVNKGAIVHFKVSTTASNFRMDIYRLGYYGGMGARNVASILNVTGRNQAACLINNTTFLVDCGHWI